MKILLVGEFSRLHNSLKEGLLKLGHEVTIIGSGDGFKNLAVDINITSKIKKNSTLSFINSLFIRTLNIDFIKIENGFRFKTKIPELKNYDVVQLINEDALFTYPKWQIKLLKKLFSKNGKVFLLCCGDDYLTTTYFLNQDVKYSVLTPYLNDKSLKNRFNYSLKYVTKPYKKLHKFIKNNSCGIIASDMDYHIPIHKEEQYLGLIPNPVNCNLIVYEPAEISNKIIIFLGINTHSSIKKGTVFFEKALQLLEEKYADKVVIKVTENLPYNEYIKTYNSAHIVLDQVYAYDQGYNALEAMAKGKVVFTGAEQEWLDFYNLEADTVAINALPNEVDIFKKLEWLILNPENIINISKNARAFIEKEHDYVAIAKRYVSVWENA